MKLNFLGNMCSKRCVADFQGVFAIVVDFLWTILKVNYLTLKGIWLTIMPMDPKDVSEEIVLITGAGHGIGRELALNFARLGARVVCVDVNASTNEDTVKNIKQQNLKAFAYQCDVTDRAAVMQLAEKVGREVGEVTILVNNAGIMPSRPLLAQTEKEIRLMNEININGNLWMLQAFLGNMMTRNHGHIVAMSSMAGVMGLGNLVPYCGSKYAVRGIMEALAIELREDPREFDGIKFTTICPYMVDTGLCKNPRIRFPSVMKVVSAEETANLIVNAVRRELVEITIPQDLHYVNRYIYRLLPFPAAVVWNDFFNTGVGSHE